jgi:RNA polymerase sporulation-specific sigma factor
MSNMQTYQGYIIYDRLVRAVVRRFVNFDIYDEDDLFQEGCIALLKAEKTFVEGKGAKFETYASRLIARRIIDILRKNGDRNGKSGRVQNDGENAYGESETFWDGRNALDRVEIDDITGETVESEVEKIEKGGLVQTVLSKISECERAIYNAYANGYSYEEIEKIFSINKKKVDNTIQKIKRMTIIEINK